MRSTLRSPVLCPRVPARASCAARSAHASPSATRVQPTLAATQHSHRFTMQVCVGVGVYSRHVLISESSLSAKSHDRDTERAFAANCQAIRERASERVSSGSVNDCWRWRSVAEAQLNSLALSSCATLSSNHADSLSVLSLSCVSWQATASASLISSQVSLSLGVSLSRCLALSVEIPVQEGLPSSLACRSLRHVCLGSR